MTSNWPRMELRDAGVSVIDCDHRTPKAADEGFPYVTIPQMQQGRLNFSEARLIAPEDFVAWTRKALPTKHDVVLSRRCNPGETAYVAAEVSFALGQNLVLLRADGRTVFPPFLRWLVQGPEWWKQVSKYLNQGAVFDSFKIADIHKFELTIPPLSEQRAIAHILGTLDDKSELNRRMNQTLEEIARVLFKSWFVDFDPVHAKAGGRQPAGMDAETAALFPSEFEESELGQIPKEWRVGTLGDIATNPRRQSSPSEVEPDTPYIGLEHMPRRSLALPDWSTADSVKSGKYHFRQGEFLFGKLRPYFHKVGIAPIDGVCSTDIVVVVPTAAEWSGFVLGLISSDAFVEFTNSSSTGTRMPRTSWAQMAGYRVAIPSPQIASAYTCTMNRLVQKILAGVSESRRLGCIRDILIPNLLSGSLPEELGQPDVKANEIRMPD